VKIRNGSNVIQETDIRVYDFTCLIILGQYHTGHGSIPGGGKIFLIPTVSRSALGPTQPPNQWVLGPLSPGVKWPGHETDHSPPSSAKVKNDGAIPPLPNMLSWCGA
jgi:hypothetical protein